MYYIGIQSANASWISVNFEPFQFVLDLKGDKVPKTVRVCVPVSDHVPPAFRGGVQDHGTRGPSSNRDLYRDPDPLYDVSRRSKEPASHLATTFAELGIHPTLSALTLEANRILKASSDQLDYPTADIPTDEEVDVTYFDDDLMTREDLPSESYLPTGADFGFSSLRKIKKTDNSVIEDWDNPRAGNKDNGGDRPMSGFHFVNL